MENMKFEIKELPRRNDYVRVYGFEVDNWDDFVYEMLEVFSCYPTEDGTVGQMAQEEQIKRSKTCSGGFNLYGRNIKPILKKIKESSIKVSG